MILYLFSKYFQASLLVIPSRTFHWETNPLNKVAYNVSSRKGLPSVMDTPDLNLALLSSGIVT